MAVSSWSQAHLLAASFLLLLVCFGHPANAFGAGNIASVAKIEGINWRHGDIEDTLLQLLISRAYGNGAKFSKLDVKRVYFGNWLRDYSQAVDVGTVKHVSAEAIRILLWVLGFLSFGYGTAEFEVTSERLGCYRPEEHIDNPKDYADNEDARRYDRRLRAPVDEKKELTIDERTGLKKYIASEDLGITTSAGLVRNLFGRAIDLGRDYNRTRNKAEFYEALRLLGTGCHCLEDYSAHSNYVELALIEMGERGIFPHVGRQTQERLKVSGLPNPVYPIVTGTFGGVDFLHSVMGEFSDKATQSEIQELEGVMQQSQGQDTSLLKTLLRTLPSGLFGGKSQAGKVDQLQANATAAQMQNLNLSRDPEAFTQQLNQMTQQIYPILEFHDEIMKGITEAIDKIPILPDLIEKIQEQISMFVFSLLAPFVLPIIKQVKTELSSGSSEVIQSSKDKQLVVFKDDHSTDPTHSMLSKDHFSNLLNEPAGKIASGVLRWVVPQIVACWDNESIDIGRTLNRIITGVFHHPALRQYGDDGAVDGRSMMYGTVEQWWHGKSEQERIDLRRRLSREGVERGLNHKEGVQDSGHGCGKPIGLPGGSGSGYSGGPAGAMMGGLNQAFGGGSSQASHGRPQLTTYASHEVSNLASQAVGGGVLGSLVGGLAGAIGAAGIGMLGSAFESDNSAQTQTYQSQGYNPDGTFTSSVLETGQRPSVNNRPSEYGQAQYKITQYPGGGHREDYQRFGQEGHGGSTGYGFEQSVETKPVTGGGYEQTSEQRWEKPGGSWESQVQTQRIEASGHPIQHEEKHHGRRHGGVDESSDSSDSGDDYAKKERKRREKAEKKERKRREDQGMHHGGGGDDSDGEKHHRKQEQQHGRKHSQEHEQHGRRYSQDHKQQGEYGGSRFDHESRPNQGEGGYEGYGQPDNASQFGGPPPFTGGFGGPGQGPPPFGGGFGGPGQGPPPFGGPFGGGFGGQGQGPPPFEGGFGGPPPFNGGYGGNCGYGRGESHMPGGFGEDERPQQHHQGGGGGFPGAEYHRRQGGW